MQLEVGHIREVGGPAEPYVGRWSVPTSFDGLLLNYSHLEPRRRGDLAAKIELLLLVVETKAALQIDLPLRSLFAAPTIVELSEKTETVFRRVQTDVEKITQVLEKLEQLSEEEVEGIFSVKGEMNRRGIR